MTNSYSSYTPVSVFDCDIKGDRIVGYAMPQAVGPCLLRLSSDDTPISYATATAYSETAAAQGLRGGWCGFELHGLRLAMGLGERVEISCAVSGRILKSVPATLADMPAAPAASRSLTVEGLLRLVREPRSCASTAQLLPFALNHYRRHGAQSFRDRAYLTILGRWPDALAPYPDDSIAEEELRIATYIEDLADSAELTEKWTEGTFIGPFHPDFRFDTTGLL